MKLLGVYLFLLGVLGFSNNSYCLTEDYVPVLMVEDMQVVAQETGKTPIGVCRDVALAVPNLLTNFYADLKKAMGNCERLANQMGLYRPPAYKCSDGSDFFQRYTGVSFSKATLLSQNYQEQFSSISHQESRAFLCMQNNLKGFFVDGLGGDVHLVGDMFSYGASGAKNLFKYESAAGLSLMSYFAPNTAAYYQQKLYDNYGIKTKQQYDEQIRKSYDQVAAFTDAFYQGTKGWGEENKEVLLCSLVNPKFSTFLKYKITADTIASLSGGKVSDEISTIDCQAIDDFVCNSLGMVGYEVAVDFLGAAIGAALVGTGAGATVGVGVITASIAKLIVKLGPQALKATLSFLKKFVKPEVYESILTQSLKYSEKISPTDAVASKELLVKELRETTKSLSLKNTTLGAKRLTGVEVKKFIDDGIRADNKVPLLQGGQELKGGREKAQRMIGGERIYGTDFSVIKKEYMNSKERLLEIYQGYKEASRNGKGVEIVDYRLTKTSKLDSFGNPVYKMELIMEDATDIAKRSSILTSVQSNQVEKIVRKIDQLKITPLEKVKLKQDVINETLLALSVHPDGHMGNVFSRLVIGADGKIKATTTSIDLDESIFEQSKVLERYKTGKISLSPDEEKVRGEFLKLSQDFEAHRSKLPKEVGDDGTISLTFSVSESSTVSLNSDMTKSISSTGGQSTLPNARRFENMNWGQELSALCTKHSLTSSDCLNVYERLEWEKLYSKDPDSLGVFKMYNFHHKRDRLCDYYKLLPKDCNEAITIESVLAN